MRNMLAARPSFLHGDLPLRSASPTLARKLDSKTAAASPVPATFLKPEHPYIAPYFKEPKPCKLAVQRSLCGHTGGHLMASLVISKTSGETCIVLKP